MTSLISTHFNFTLLITILILIQSNTTIQSKAYTSSTSSIRLPQSHTLPPPPVTLSITDYGATGDGITYDTVSIQSAIDDCTAAGGGRVLFPPGRYLTATVYLKSGVVLEVQKNATVIGGTRIEDYAAEQDRWYVVVAEDAVDVGITGGGEINGQGLEFVVRFNEKKNVMVSWNETGKCSGDECRPRLIGFIRCRNVRVWDIALAEPAYWWLVDLSFFVKISYITCKLLT